MAEKGILVMDDDEGIRNTISMILSLYGFKVVGVATGEEALERIKDGEVFGCALFDVNNDKGMGAIPTMRCLKEMKSDLKVVVMSSAHPAVKEPDRFGFEESLEKPFTPEQLLNIVNLVLARGRQKK